MAISSGFELLTSALADTTIFNISWIISLIFVFFTLLIITRDVNKWKSLAFPVTILWHIVGITPSFLFYILTGMIFVIDALSLQAIGNVLGAVVNTTKEATNKSKNKSLIKLASKERDRRGSKKIKSVDDKELLKILKRGRL
jgi:hypothetical protein